ncbi:MAG: hypothetical protein ACT4P5_06005 [Armatimonadota bacterium]
MRRVWRTWTFAWTVVVTVLLAFSIGQPEATQLEWLGLQSFRPTIVPVSVAAAALSSSSRVGPTGVGPIVFGTTPAQAAATGTKFVATKPSRGSSCFYLRPPTPSGLSFMVEHGTIRRAEVATSTIRTADGFLVGDSALRIETFYGQRARLAPDKYDPKAQTITILPKGSTDAKYRMVFKVKGGTVQAIIAGALPQVAYVEGCS